MPTIKWTPMSKIPDTWKGRKVRDSVSGWTGYCVAKYYYLNGCVRVEIAGQNDGKPEGFVFDEHQLVWADRWIHGFEPDVNQDADGKFMVTGGPRDKTPIPR